MDLKLSSNIGAKNGVSAPLNPDATGDSTAKATRDVMKQYFVQHSVKNDLTEMMLDLSAEENVALFAARFSILDDGRQDELSPGDIRDVMSFIQPYIETAAVAICDEVGDVKGGGGKGGGMERRLIDCAELGAGIGRYTCLLAPVCRRLVTIDFMAGHVERSRRDNAHLNNADTTIDFRCGDVMELQLADASLDFVFSNWLFMYLNDDEVLKLLSRALDWLRPGGFLFFRESCGRRSGNAPRDDNPTFYRKIVDYDRLVLRARDSRQRFAFTLLRAHSSQLYVERKANPYQVCWMMTKLPVKNVSPLRYQLDSVCYTPTAIRKYELSAGEDGDAVHCTGGLSTIERVLSKVQTPLTADHRLLDVGSGLGALAFRVASRFGAHVTGIELSANMFDRALLFFDQQFACRLPVVFELSDVRRVDWIAPNSYDVITSLDAILHVDDKAKLVKRFFDWLKPGGELLITDYCCEGEADEWSSVFRRYVSNRDYHLIPIDAYARLLEEAGFQVVEASDETERFVEFAGVDYERVVRRRDAVSAAVTDDGVRESLDECLNRRDRAVDGPLRWGFFHARKPTTPPAK